MNHIEIDGYITHMRKLSDESVLLGIGSLDNYSVAIFQNQKLEIVNTFSFSDLGVDMILDLELTNSGILAYERNLASKEATYISLYDFSGELEWTKILDETGNKRIAYICSVYENYFYAIGGKAGLATVWKIHLDGTLLWEKNFSQYYEVESAVENQMGEIFIASMLPNYDELIEKHIDITPSAEPQPIWKVNLKSTLKLDDYLLFQSLPIPTLDGGTIIILSEEISKYKTNIEKLSSSGKVQWHEIYSVGPPQGLNVLELANQNVLIISLYGIVTMYKK